jgi:hypothetical protein
MDSNWNSQQWQQQYHDPNQQYAQPLQQQSTGTLHYDYSLAAQQTPYESQSAQQGGSQPSYQGLMQQFPAQQPLPNTQLPQQQSYQYYQGHSSVDPALSALAGQWTQTQPNAQWQTATNNATATTTTTTTTTKCTKEMQASQPQHATSSTAFDFSSLMQQLPPQQAPQEAMQQATQQQQAYNYSQTMQNVLQQQSLPSPAPDFAQFMQNNPPPTQNTVEFSQLLQTAPPPLPPPQPQVSQAPPVVQTPAAPQKVQPQKAQSSKQGSKSTNKSKNTSTTTVVGSSSRQEAAKQGKTELRRFDQNVSNRLKQFAGNVLCPLGFDYYATRQGYLCGGGTHFFSHESVEAMLKHGRVPELEDVNGDAYDRQVTPPPDDVDWTGRQRPVWTDWHWMQVTRELRAEHELLKSMRNRGFR